MWFLLEYEAVIDCLKLTLFSLDVNCMKFMKSESPAQEVLVSVKCSLEACGLHGVRVFVFESHPTTSTLPEGVIELFVEGREEERKCFEWLDWKIKCYDHDFEAMVWQGRYLLGGCCCCTKLFYSVLCTIYLCIYICMYLFESIDSTL